MKRLPAIPVLFGAQATVTGHFGLNYVAERSP